MGKMLTTEAVAERLGLSVQRIQAKVRQGHFPNHTLCECGRRSTLIPETDLKLKAPDGRRKK